MPLPNRQKLDISIHLDTVAEALEGETDRIGKGTSCSACIANNNELN